MENCFISVIIPTYNEEFYIGNLLLDLQKQSFDKFEIIIIDANSPDGTVKIAMRFASLLPLKIYESAVKNVSYQRNKGAKKAIGNYLLFLDADSRVNEEFIKTAYQNIILNPSAIYLPKLIPEESNLRNNTIFKCANFIIAISQLLPKQLSAGGTLLIKKSVFSQIKGFDSNLFLCEDHNLLQKVYKTGEKAQIIDELKLTVSLRRIRKEGVKSYVWKHITSTVHLYIKGDIKDKIYAYEMGGKHYNNRE